MELQCDELPALLHSLQSQLSAKSTYRELITGLNCPLEVIGKCDLLHAGVEALPSLAELIGEFPAVGDRPLGLARRRLDKDIAIASKSSVSSVQGTDIVGFRLRQVTYRGLRGYSDPDHRPPVGGQLGQLLCRSKPNARVILYECRKATGLVRMHRTHAFWESVASGGRSLLARRNGSS